MEVNAKDEEDFWLFAPTNELTRKWFAACGAYSLTITDDGFFSIDASEVDDIIASFERIGGKVNIRL